MSAIGSLIFCTDCGALLRESTGDKNAVIVCDVCGARNRGELNFLVSEKQRTILHSCLADFSLRYNSTGYRFRVETERFPLGVKSEEIRSPDLDCGR
jgi:hypothetical protein